MRRFNGESARRHRITTIVACIVFATSTGERLLGQCPEPPTVLSEQFVDSGSSATVAIRNCGEFIVGWQTPPASLFDTRNEIRVLRYAPDGTAIPPMASVASTNEPERGSHTEPSIAMSAVGHVEVAWTGILGQVIQFTNLTLLTNRFDFDGFVVIPVVPPGHPGNGDHEASVGTSDFLSGGNNVSAISWSNRQASPGLHLQVDGTGAVIRSCTTWCPLRVQQWQPCVSERSDDGYFAVVFAYDEDPLLELSPFNIAIQIYGPDGTLVAERAGPDVNNPAQWVNDPSLEDATSELDTSQVSPAVSFVGEDIVVCWVGPGLTDCGGAAVRNIYARRFKFDTQNGELNDPNPLTGQGLAGIFVVDTDATEDLDPEIANPTVALTLSDENPGRFVVAWNAIQANGTVHEVRARYLDHRGWARGGEFLVNQQPGTGNVA